jgi:peroxiredoxin
MRTAMAMVLISGVMLGGCKSGQKQCPVPTADSIAAMEVKGNSAPGSTERGLRVGDMVPNADLATILGSDVHLADLIGAGPTVIVFYRGGWCPYCQGDLTEWQDHLAEVKALGGSVIAITPEAPNRAEATSTKNKLGFEVLSDVKGEAAAGFDLGFTLDDATQQRYTGYGIDLTAINAQHNWDLVIPATYLVDRSGVIRYAYVNEDYKQRADPSEVITALKAISNTP